MSGSFSLSIVIPAYNEEEIIVSSVQQTLNAVQAAVADFEIIIVDDCSRDSTKALIEANINKWPSTRLVCNAQNGGFGAAVWTGLQAATKEYVLCVPVDSPMDTETLAPFITAAPTTDVISSFRVKRVGYTNRMRFNSWAYHKLIGWVFGLKLKDYNWIHLYRRAIFDKVHYQSRGIFMMAEVLVEANKHGYRIAEIPVDQKQRMTGIATSAKLSTILFVLEEMYVYLKRKKA
jgi:glycosyltransferase involved in cell wall biosynthesis